MSTGEKVRELRRETRMTQGELATSAGVSQGYLSQIENDGVKSISLPIAFRLAEALGVTIYDLLSEKHLEIDILPGLARKLTKMSQRRQRALLAFLETSDA